jgi:penicillin-binding protein activator
LSPLHLKASGLLKPARPVLECAALPAVESGGVLELTKELFMKTTLSLMGVLAIGLATSGCGKEYVRGSQDPSIDNAAMSTGIDKDDIQRMLKENLDNLRTAPIMNQWRTDRGQDTVSIFPFQNETSEHIESGLSAILGEAETWLVDAGTVTVISRERQNQMIAEVEGHTNPVFNPAHIAQYGKQLGAKYFITGKVASSDERTDDARRVQYFFFMQVIEVETSAIRWQHKAYVTKMVR